MTKLQPGDYVRDNDRRENETSSRILVVEAVEFMLPRGYAKNHRYSPDDRRVVHAILKEPGYTGNRRHNILLSRIYVDGKPRRTGMALCVRQGILLTRLT